VVPGKIYAGDIYTTLFVQSCLNPWEIDQPVKLVGICNKVSCHANDKDRNDQDNGNRALLGYAVSDRVQNRHFHWVQNRHFHWGMTLQFKFVQYEDLHLGHALEAEIVGEKCITLLIECHRDLQGIRGFQVITRTQFGSPFGNGSAARSAMVGFIEIRAILFVEVSKFRYDVCSC